ncbi:hypothetical protein BDZ91DRAFT_126921 [Kalaharituber pfeilii]|nr:hypothetical protein BDZ91DRAFT_126921 [Kalaharituber pfeilii]
MATMDPEYSIPSRRDDSPVTSREPSPRRGASSSRKPRSELTSTKILSDRGTDPKPKRHSMLKPDMLYSMSEYEEIMPPDPVLASSAPASSSSLSSPARRRRIMRLSSQFSSTSSPHDDTGISTPSGTPTRANTMPAPHNHSNGKNNHHSSHVSDYTSAGYSATENGHKSYKHSESPKGTPRKPSYPHQRHSSTTSLSGRRHSHYTFEAPSIGTIPYSYSPEEYVDEPEADDDATSDIQPSTFPRPSTFPMASTAVLKPNLRSGDPYKELSRFLDNVNGMLSSLTLSIPHLQLLCDRYRSLQDKLQEYTALLSVTRAQEAAITQKTKQVESLRQKLDQMASMHSAEGNRLRNRIGTLEAEIRVFKDIVKEKDREMEELARRCEEEKETLRREVGMRLPSAKASVESGEDGDEETATITKSQLEALAKHEVEAQILRERHEAQLTELEAAHAAEKASIRQIYESKIAVLEQKHSAELSTILEERATELDSSHRQLAQQLENNHQLKISALKDSHAVGLRSLESRFHSKIESLKSEFQKRKKALDDAHRAEKQKMEAKFKEEREVWVAEKEQLEGQIKYLQYEKNTTAFTHEAEKNTLLEMVENAEEQGKKLERENERVTALLKKIGEAEEGHEIKGRGDGFYIDAFTTLAKDIIDISHKFLNLPRIPPSDVISQIPPSLPNILSNTDASRILRQAYIQHVISKVICQRIFSPFLFSLANRYDNADSLLKAMSTHLRRKSTRKEAIWRNYTLMAAFTSSSAKAHASTAAASVIDEIIAKIRPFAESENMDRIFAGVRRVVKYAIDTWRYARLEKEMFIARLETENDDAQWGCHLYESQFPYIKNSQLVESLKRDVEGGRREKVLNLLPIVYREGTVTSLTQSDTPLDDGKVFSPGVALFSDCLPVVHRRVELHQNGNGSDSGRMSSGRRTQEEYERSVAVKEINSDRSSRQKQFQEVTEIRSIKGTDSGSSSRQQAEEQQSVKETDSRRSSRHIQLQEDPVRQSSSAGTDSRRSSRIIRIQEDLEQRASSSSRGSEPGHSSRQRETDQVIQESETRMARQKRIQEEAEKAIREIRAIREREEARIKAEQEERERAKTAALIEQKAKEAAKIAAEVEAEAEAAAAAAATTTAAAMAAATAVALAKPRDDTPLQAESMLQKADSTFSEMAERESEHEEEERGRKKLSMMRMMRMTRYIPISRTRTQQA